MNWFKNRLKSFLDWGPTRKKGLKELSKIETKLNITLPLIYKNFYLKCLKSRPKELIGTDLFHDNKDLHEGALELLDEDGAKNFLSEKDFVFMMHQGYMFWYFRADGNENPNVYGYFEQSLKPNLFSDLEQFLNDYMHIK